VTFYRLPWRGHACKYLWLVDNGKVVTWSCASSCRQICTPPHPGVLEQELYKTASRFSCKWGEDFVHAETELKVPLSSKGEWTRVCTNLMKKTNSDGTVMYQNTKLKIFGHLIHT